MQKTHSLEPFCFFLVFLCWLNILILIFIPFYSIYSVYFENSSKNESSFCIENVIDTDYYALSLFHIIINLSELDHIDLNQLIHYIHSPQTRLITVEIQIILFPISILPNISPYTQLSYYDLHFKSNSSL